MSDSDVQVVTATDRPDGVPAFRKTALTYFEWRTEPFQVQTMEGTTYVISEDTDAWDGGYFVAWPDDGTDPYPVAKSFVETNYEPA